MNNKVFKVNKVLSVVKDYRRHIVGEHKPYDKVFREFLLHPLGVEGATSGAERSGA